MPAPNFEASDYADVFLKLLPRGAAWPRDPEAMPAQVGAALAPTFARVDRRFGELLVDAFPSTAVGLLPEWEATLGLPDPCAGPAPSVQARQAQVTARISNPGGQSIAYLTWFAGQLGYVVTIQNFAPFRFGRSGFGQGLGGKAWYNAFAVTAPLNNVRKFRAGSRAGERLREWGDAVLECELRRIAPAHTVVIFRYV